VFQTLCPLNLLQEKDKNSEIIAKIPKDSKHLILGCSYKNRHPVRMPDSEHFTLFYLQTLPASSLQQSSGTGFA
jgi:hypothetical protein